MPSAAVAGAAGFVAPWLDNVLQATKLGIALLAWHLQVRPGRALTGGEIRSLMMSKCLSDLRFDTFVTGGSANFR